jgi:H+/gluconate symporter-like permease
MFRKNINDMSDCISQGFNDGIMPCILISAVVGIGSVIAETPVFAIIRDNVINLPINGLTKIALVTTIVSGVCASATGGLKITMDLFGKQFLAMGFPPEIVHRVAAIASGGLDSLPWCGTIVTLFTLSGVGYNKGYKAVAVETVILPIVASLLAVLVYTVRISIMG